MGWTGKDLQARKFMQADFTAELYWKLAHRVRSTLWLGVEKTQMGQFLICTRSKNPEALFDRINQTLASEKCQTFIIKSKIQSPSRKRTMAGFFLFSNPNIKNREVVHWCLAQTPMDDYSLIQDCKLLTRIPLLGWGDKVFKEYQWDGTPNSGPPLAIVLWAATEIMEKLNRQMAELFLLVDRLDKPLCKPWVYVKKPNNKFNQMNNAKSDMEIQQFKDQHHRQWEFFCNISHMEVHNTCRLLQVYKLLIDFNVDTIKGGPLSSSNLSFDWV
jgi:hypothetical protein